ncbi:MAG: carbohydrate ABC transporter permease, partial [Clostridiaceae bacterium]|nr:carbohydrate ABC transporter permease [Clostridiaceae bacterium]
ILDVLWIWNDYLLPSLILLSPAQRTLPLSTYSFFQSYSVDYAPLMAGVVLSILPVLIAYVFAQKHIITGVVQGAIK